MTDMSSVAEINALVDKTVAQFGRAMVRPRGRARPEIFHMPGLSASAINENCPRTRTQSPRCTKDREEKVAADRAIHGTATTADSGAGALSRDAPLFFAA
jgi:hypothetical protein